MFSPFAHQAHELTLSATAPWRGLFWEPGLGKTKTILDTAASMVAAKLIEGVLVLAPNGVHANWSREEIPAHLPPDLQTNVFTYHSSKASGKAYQAAAEAFLKARHPLSILLMSFDAIMTDAGSKFARRFLDSRDCLYVLDESHLIKTPGSKRTKRVMASAVYAPFRRVCTGTLVENSPFDAYSQVKWLNPNAWDELGCSNSLAFKNYFGNWEQMRTRDGACYPLLKSYKNLGDLNRIILAHGSRLLKEDCLDLPPKLYSTRSFDLSPAARRIYDELRTEYQAQFDDGQLTAALAIQRMVRLQQVTSGFLPTDDDETKRPIEDTNLRVNLLSETVESLGDTPGIVWAKYDLDIDYITERLRKEGYKVTVLDGRTKDRQASMEAFQKTGEAQWMVAKPSVGGTGFTLTRARVQVHYNTTFDPVSRKQSEDRSHRIGQEHPVLIIDLVATNSIDGYIIRNLRKKKATSNIVMGDPPRDWI